ncbi:MAG: hypothetical protein ABW221_16850 [Vicinamibacteria bacterium]
MDRAKRLFKAWRGGESSHGAAPLPDETAPFLAPDGEALADVVYAQSGALRVGISKDAGGVYRLRAERWAPEFEVTGVAAWSPYEQLAKTGKSMERARKIAHEWLGDRGEAPREEAEE